MRKGQGVLVFTLSSGRNGWQAVSMFEIESESKASQVLLLFACAFDAFHTIFWKALVCSDVFVPDIHTDQLADGDFYLLKKRSFYLFPLLTIDFLLWLVKWLIN